MAAAGASGLFGSAEVQGVSGFSIGLHTHAYTHLSLSVTQTLSELSRMRKPKEVNEFVAKARYERSQETEACVWYRRRRTCRSRGVDSGGTWRTGGGWGWGARVLYLVVMLLSGGADGAAPDHFASDSLARDQVRAAVTKRRHIYFTSDWLLMSVNT